MTVRARLLDTLRATGLRVDPTNTVRSYVDGVVYALDEPTELTQLVSYSVVVAVNVGQDTAEPAARCLVALNDSAEFTPIDGTTEYGAAPVAGRDMPDADLVRITVLSNTLFGEPQ